MRPPQEELILLNADQRQLVQALERYLTAETGTATEVTGLELMTGGNAREMWAFDATVRGEPRHLLLRKDPPGGGPHAIRFQLEREAEFKAMQVARATGIPVAEVFWLIDDATVFGEAGFIMERLEGETIPRRFLREPKFEGARQKAAYQLGQILGRLQAMDYAGLNLKETQAGEHPAVQQLDEYAGFLDELDDPRPAFELGLRWLRDHVPASWRPGLVHGDFRNGNLMFDESGVRAVLDWELVHPGDPMEDIGWLCVRSWRYGNADKPVGGFGNREDLFAGYATTAGFEPDNAAVKYWELLGTLKWGILSSSNKTKREQRIGVASGVMAAPGRALESLAQSRRAAEMEFDVLQLLREM